MTDLRKAAEMALDALHNIDQSNNDDAIQALRQALAQPEWVGFNKSEMSVLIGVAQFADDAEKFIKYVEAKLKEKNGG